MENKVDSNKWLSVNDVMNIIQSLSRSQGFYGRLYEAITDARENNPAVYNEFVDTVNKAHFVNKIDVILFFET